MEYDWTVTINGEEIPVKAADVHVENERVVRSDGFVKPGEIRIELYGAYATPDKELRELMGELEDLSEQHKENADDWHHGFGCGVGRVINELEELIGDE